MFSAGYDIGNLEGQEFEEDAERLVAHPFHDALEALEAYPYPVVAQLNGHAIGGGLELALTCDIRIAARGVKLGMPPAKLGLIYSHTGLKQVPRGVRRRPTPPSCSTSAATSTPTAARSIGLVNHVVEPDELEERALEMAGEIAANAPLSLAGNKRIMRALRAEPLTPEQERELVELRESCFRSEDFREGVQRLRREAHAAMEGPLGLPAHLAVDPLADRPDREARRCGRPCPAATSRRARSPRSGSAPSSAADARAWRSTSRRSAPASAAQKSARA